MAWRSRSGALRTLAGLARLTHPFPSILDGVATAGISLLVGGNGEVALRLGLSMTALQTAIGTLNDLVDTPMDAGRPDKPLATGVVSRPLARAQVAVAIGLGLLLAAPSGGALVAVALVVVAIGFAYDLALKGTVWSWLPFAVGIPLLPVFAAVGTSGTLGPRIGLLVVAGVLAGAALALANQIADVERDRASGTASAAARLGRHAWAVHATLLGCVVGIAVVTLADLPPAARGGGWFGLGIAGVAAGLVIVGGGAVLLRAATAEQRERGWELEAVGVAVLAVGWLAASGLGG